MSISPQFDRPPRPKGVQSTQNHCPLFTNETSKKTNSKDQNNGATIYKNSSPSPKKEEKTSYAETVKTLVILYANPSKEKKEKLIMLKKKPETKNKSVEADASSRKKSSSGKYTLFIITLIDNKPLSKPMSPHRISPSPTFLSPAPTPPLPS
ncbi:unnamed protein product [Acanthosepion pharaonis]|uniref:Uncharacterized protein n=1 Tax=Acanthosepion pharaonis TaxID=158019 RepID=A0A812E3F0_ACAPH|nr:unnamed protein product [Sepia pharaonis]